MKTFFNKKTLTLCSVGLFGALFFFSGLPATIAAMLEGAPIEVCTGGCAREKTIVCPSGYVVTGLGGEAKDSSRLVSVSSFCRKVGTSGLEGASTEVCSGSCKRESTVSCPDGYAVIGWGGALKNSSRWDRVSAFCRKVSAGGLEGPSKEVCTPAGNCLRESTVSCPDGYAVTGWGGTAKDESRLAKVSSFCTKVVGSPGTILIRATKNGVAWNNASFTVNASMPGGTQDVSIVAPQDFSGSSIGMYTANNVVPPAGYVLKNVNGNSLPYGQTLPPGQTITFTYNFVTAPPTTGTIKVRATKDGTAWDSPVFTVHMSIPGSTGDMSVDPPQDLAGSAAGTYTINNVVPPPGYILQKINGSQLPYSQTLSAGQTITFTYNFATVVVPPPPVPTLVITPSSANVNVGGIQQFNAIYDPDGSGLQPWQTVTNSSLWSSSDNSVASINSIGSATGKAPGSVTIAAQYNGMSANPSASLTVMAAITPTLDVTPSSASVPVGDSKQFTAAYDPDGSGLQSPRDVTTPAAWSSADTAKVTVSGGLVKRVGYGWTSISASYSGLSDTAYVLDSTVPSCTLSANPSSITTGSSSSSSLSWTTANATSFSIDHGVGSVSLSGSRSVSPTATVTYTGTATGAGGTATCTAIVTVASPSDKLPIGYHDGTDNATCTTFGWATDPDNTSIPLSVRLYSDGVLVKTVTANQNRGDLTSVCSGGNCAFNTSLSGLISTGVAHSIKATALDAQTGQEVDIGNTPHSITCAIAALPDLTVVVTNPAPTFDIKSDFVFNSESDIYAIGMDNQIWHWNGSTWSQFSYGGAFQYKLKYVSPTKIYGIGLDNGLGGGGAIWRYNGGGASCTLATCWTRITAGTIKDDFVLVNDSESNILAIGIDNGIYRWNGSSWSPYSSWGAMQSSLYWSGTALYGIGLDAGVGQPGCVWRFSPGDGSWAKIACTVKDDFTLVNNLENNIYAIGANNWIYHFVNGNPDYTNPSGGYFQKRLVYVSPTQIYSIGSDNNIWKWNGTLGNWTRVTTPPSPGSISPTSATAGMATVFSATIQNIGTGSTGTGFTNLFQRASGAGGTGTITDIGTFFQSTALLGSASATAPLSYTFASPGTYSMRVCADKSSSSGTGTITESNEGNNCGAWTDITVAPPAILPVTVTLSANPTSISSGQSSNLTWVTANATGCTASASPAVPGWSGSKAYTDGSHTQSTGPLNTTTTFTMVCSNSNGSASASAPVTVRMPLPPTASLLVSKTPGGTYDTTVTIDKGQSAWLKWSSTNADSCTAMGGFATGGATSGSASVSPSATSNYQISCTGVGGSADSNIATVTVVSVTTSISASPPCVQVGGSTKISWSATPVSQVASCNVSGPGLSSSQTSGSQTVNLAGKSTYTIACQTKGGSTVTKQVIVDVAGCWSEF